MGSVLELKQSFTRPADTTAYAANDLVANSTTAGSVVPLEMTNNTFLGGAYIRRARLYKSGTSVTNTSFRVHIYKSSPTPANGDNGAFSTNNVADYLGALDVTIDRAFTDGSFGVALPMIGNEINFTDSTDDIFALIEAKAAYTPASGEVFTLTLELHRD